MHHIVDDERHAGLFVYDAEVLDHHLIIRAEKVMDRRDLNRIHAEALDGLDRTNRLPRAVHDGTGDERHVGGHRLAHLTHAGSEFVG